MSACIAFSNSHLRRGLPSRNMRRRRIASAGKRAALAEGMVFAEALGLSAQDFLSMAKASAAYSAVMDSKGQSMVDRDFSPQGRIVQSAKDFTLIRDSASAAGQGLPFTETYLAMMQDALDQGEGDLDNAAVLLPIARTPAPVTKKT